MPHQPTENEAETFQTCNVEKHRKSGTPLRIRKVTGLNLDSETGYTN
jgi:hypothetical protein